MRNILNKFIILFLFLFICSVAGAEEINWNKLVEAVIKIESGRNPNAVSVDGCIGLMQISSIVLEEYIQVEKRIVKAPLFDPDWNKELGTWYLHRLHDHYKCETVEAILAGYNGGITCLRKNNYDIRKMPRETRRYVKRVMKIYEDLVFNAQKSEDICVKNKEEK